MHQVKGYCLVKAQSEILVPVQAVTPSFVRMTCAALSVAEDPAGDRVIMHDVSFSPDTPAAVRMRLEYETARLAFPVTGPDDGSA
jgi:hypothetical protein